MYAYIAVRYGSLSATFSWQTVTWVINNKIVYEIFSHSSPAVVKECQINFNFLPVKLQLSIRTARFLQKFVASLNSLCLLFQCKAKNQLRDIFAEANCNVNNACAFRNAIYEQFNSDTM